MVLWFYDSMKYLDNPSVNVWKRKQTNSTLKDWPFSKIASNSFMSQATSTTFGPGQHLAQADLAACIRLPVGQEGRAPWPHGQGDGDLDPSRGHLHCWAWASTQGRSSSPLRWSSFWHLYLHCGTCLCSALESNGREWLFLQHSHGLKMSKMQ